MLLANAVALDLLETDTHVLYPAQKTGSWRYWGKDG